MKQNGRNKVIVGYSDFGWVPLFFALMILSIAGFISGNFLFGVACLIIPTLLLLSIRKFEIYDEYILIKGLLSTKKYWISEIESAQSKAGGLWARPTFLFSLKEKKYNKATFSITSPMVSISTKRMLSILFNQGVALPEDLIRRFKID